MGEEYTSVIYRARRVAARAGLACLAIGCGSNGGVHAHVAVAARCPDGQRCVGTTQAPGSGRLPVERVAHNASSRPAAAPPAEQAAPGGAPKEPVGRDATSESVAVEDDLVRGRSTVRVAARLEQVRKVVLKYNDYAKFMPFYTSSHVVDKDDHNSQIYMQVAALNGLVKMGAQISIPNAAKNEQGWDVYESTFVNGNVIEFKAIWRMKPIDETSAFLSLEVFLLPKLPLPARVLNAENTAGAVDGVKAMRERIEQRLPQ